MGGFAGIDPSLTGSGLAHSSGECRLIGRDGITKLPIAQQFGAIGQLADAVVSQIRAWSPELVVIEQLDMARAYGGAIQRTVLWWDIARSIHQGCGVPILTAASAQGKIYATGSSLSTKKQIVAAVHDLWPHFEVGNNDNLADAAVYCAMGAASQGSPLSETPLGAIHTRALVKLQPIDRPTQKKTSHGS